MSQNKIQQAVELKSLNMRCTPVREILAAVAIIVGIVYMTVCGLLALLGFTSAGCFMCVVLFMCVVSYLQRSKSKDEYNKLIASFSEEEKKELEKELEKEFEDSEARLNRMIAEADEFYKTNKDSFDETKELIIKEHEQHIEDLTKQGFTLICYGDNDETKVFEIKNVVKRNIKEFNVTKLLPFNPEYKTIDINPEYKTIDINPKYKQGFRYIARTPICLHHTYNLETAKVILKLWADFLYSQQNPKEATNVEKI